MSEDVALFHRCPHYVVQEVLTVQTDRKTLVPLQAPSSALAMQMHFNDIDIPQSGLQSKARIIGSGGGPFLIRTGVNDEFSLQVDLGALQTVTLPQGTFSLEDVAEFLSDDITGATVTVENIRLVIEADSVGDESSLYLRDSTSFPTLGFRPLFRQGSVLIPAWGLIKNPLSEDPGARLVQFTDPLRSENDVILFDYYTSADRCRRCHNLRVEYDFHTDAAGNVIMLENEDLLLQEIEKILLTVKGSNIFHTWYGTSLIDLIGKKGGLAEATTMSITQEISNALSRYREVKSQQSRVQRVTNEEFLLRVLSLNVVQNEQDPTLFQIALTVQNRSMKPVDITRNIVVPDAPFLQERSAPRLFPNP